jgi:pimeloyl-ACP methyl ester carboxylesterase
MAIACGCQHDAYAQKLLKPDTSFGKLSEAMCGTPQQLIKLKRIDEHLSMAGADAGVVIDTWLINPRPSGGATTAPASKGAVVLLHGLGDCKASYLAVGEELAARGYTAVLMDLRVHGASTGSCITYGAREKYDLLTVMTELQHRGKIDGPIYVFGVDLGAAVAIQYAALDCRVKGIVAVAPYRNFTDITGWIYRPMLQADRDKVVARAGQMGEFDPAEASAEQFIRQVRCPVLLAHNALDLSVPMEHSTAVYEAANQPKRLMVVTPVVEQAVIGLLWGNWIADRIDQVASGRLNDEPAATSPAT